MDYRCESVESDGEYLFSDLAVQPGGAVVVEHIHPVHGERFSDFNTEGMIHIGLVPELIEDARRTGVSDEDMDIVFKSAEAYVRVWERTKARRSRAWRRSVNRNILPSLLLVLAACGDAKEVVDLDERFDGAGVAPPVTEGEWYRPSVATTWQWQLTAADGDPNTTYDVDAYDLDLFDTDPELIDALQSEDQAVICYFSAGSREEWRPDADAFDDADVGRPLDGWKGERWLDVRSEAVLAIMEARLDRAAERGCDGVEPDNVDGFTNRSGFDLEAEDQVAYNRALANAAHERGLAIALKNTGDLAAELEPYFDFSLNEECHRYDECDQLRPFTNADKPIWNAEYTPQDTRAAADELADAICPKAREAEIRTLILPLELDDSFRVSCDE